MQLFRLATLLMYEWISPRRVERRPEPAGLMDTRTQVEAFHAQGELALMPVYHFNAEATSRMTPFGGTVVDLGSGSAKYLAYLARCRPDLHIIGIELAPTMVAVGRDWLTNEGLGERVDLREGDMTQFAARLDGPVDLISSVFSLHHLPGSQQVAACLSEIGHVRGRTGCGLWIFDHARPRHPATAELFPSVFTPTAAPAFNADSTNSLIASWSFDELRNMLDQAGFNAAEHWLSRWLRLYQVHRLSATAPHQPAHVGWHEPRLSPEASKDLRRLHGLFPQLPDGG